MMMVVMMMTNILSRTLYMPGTVLGHFTGLLHDFPGGSDCKAPAYNSGDLGLIPGLGRSPGEGNSNPLQYCCLENPMDGGTW